MTQFGTPVLPTYGLPKAIRLVFSTLAILTFACCALAGWHTAGYALGLATLVGLSYLYHARNRDRFVGAQVLVLGAFLVAYAGRIGITNGLLIASGIVTAGLLLNQELFAGARPVEVANLPGRGLGGHPLIDPRLAAAAHTGLICLIGVGAAFGLPIWIIAVCTLIVAGASIAHVGKEVLRRKRRRQTRRLINKAVDRHQPEFAVYFSAPPETEYQVTSWLPYLERIGRPFIIILREPQPFATISAATTAPVLVCTAVQDVDNLVVPSLKAVFYVNNGAKNAHMVRFNQLTHIQLLHGDSDKASSYNPVTAMFDRIFVAGQAAIDRYADNGVYIDPVKFEIVGRPQIEPIQVAGANATPHVNRTVMYGTTWAGLYSDANYCSLEIGPTIVEELLRREITVIFRPHPYVERNAETRAQAERVEALLAADRSKSGRAHLFGKESLAMSLFDCFNRADAMISDVSAIASDFLYSEKPLALTDMADDGPGFVRKFPVSKAAHVLRRDGSNLVAVVDELLQTDSLAETRRRVKHHYLGDFPADSYADGFVEASRRELLSSRDEVVAAV